MGIATTPAHVGDTLQHKQKRCITDSCLLNFGGMEMKWSFHLKELTVQCQRLASLARMDLVRNVLELFAICCRAAL